MLIAERVFQAVVIALLAAVVSGCEQLDQKQYRVIASNDVNSSSGPDRLCGVLSEVAARYSLSAVSSTDDFVFCEFRGESEGNTLVVGARFLHDVFVLVDVWTRSSSLEFDELASAVQEALQATYPDSLVEIDELYPALGAA